MRKQLFIVIILFFFPALILFAQNKDGAVILPDTLIFPFIKITEVSCTGNKLTKAKIISRELDFKIGDSLRTYKHGDKLDFSTKRFTKFDSSELSLKLHH